MSMLQQIKHAIANLNPEEVRQSANRSLAVGLVASAATDYTAMEKFLAPPREMSRERRAEALSMLHRSGDPGIPDRFDLVLYEYQLAPAENAFTFHSHAPERTIKEVLAAKSELGLPLARQFPP